MKGRKPILIALDIHAMGPVAESKAYVCLIANRTNLRSVHQWIGHFLVFGIGKTDGRAVFQFLLTSPL